MPKLGTRMKTIVLAGGVTAMIAAPFAFATGEGQPARGGARNPSNNQSLNYTRETEIIANVDSYGTRQSNKSNNGGGAVYGCRSRAGGTPRNNEPCLRASNLVDGRAFEFNSNSGTEGGAITVGAGGDSRKPFVTNATGVATGLNADEVDGRDGADLLGKTEKAADADKLDGADSADFARKSDLLFARVGAGDTVSGRGAVSATTVGNTTTVTFSQDVNNCSFTATDNEGAPQPLSAVSTGARTVDVTGTADPRPFHLQVIC
jgi:hypothetical protein